MAEYIEREEVMPAIDSEVELYLSEYYAISNRIDQIPAADVVKIVRCKDCEYYGGITFGNICRRWSAINSKNCTKPDDYCSYGERKDGNGNGL